VGFLFSEEPLMRHGPWDTLPFHSLNFHLRQRFGEKIVKLCLDGGFSCPNRDGTIDTAGCLFCDETGSGNFAGSRNQSLHEQLVSQRALLASKWNKNRFIAYFQNFTATHASVDRLRTLFFEAAELPGCAGVAIATRPDCLEPEKIDLLKEIAQRTYLWVELGLQTIHDHSAHLLNRGYPLDTFEATLQRLHAADIPVVVHLILGIPGETKADMTASVDRLSALGVEGLKLHLLHIHRGTALAALYETTPFTLFSEEDYINSVADLIERIPPRIVLHRITGDGTRGRLVAPLWSLNKKRVYTGIVDELRRRGTWQGAKAPHNALQKSAR
jgi:radical SAM protein (TIGR01212 family)